MRAKQLRARHAARTGALSLTVAGATVAALASASAVALAAQAPHQPHRRPMRHAHLRVQRGQIATPTGSTVVVHGVLEPGWPGAEVRLETLTRRHWRTLAVARTHSGGRFGIPYRVRRPGASWIRVRFPGGRHARAASASAGRIVALVPTVASWYYDAGSTACGFHATYGVANRTLPCGTKVTLAYGGRTVVATVDDRGPYVYGRSFDLNQNTARYLGMWGVGTVLASV
jgi:rare lipoprotein A